MKHVKKLEHIIDVLHEPYRGKRKKPRTYRQKARKDYLSITKQRKPRGRTIRKAVRMQLNYVARDLRIISELEHQGNFSRLSKQEYRQMLVISELYRQQQEMYDTRKHCIDDRIVNISQPHVRPIVRGKAKAGTEFGAKINISLIDSYAHIETVSWDNYNEGTTLIEATENYKKRFGYYSEAILVDQIYRNRDNREYCKKKGIRLSGPALGRPSKEKVKEQKQLEKQDATERIEIEGKFGVGKRRYWNGTYFDMPSTNK